MYAIGLGVFPVEFSVEIVLQESVDNCLLISNPFAQMVRSVDCRNQKLIFDDDVSECLSELYTSSSKTRTLSI